MRARTKLLLLTALPLAALLGMLELLGYALGGAEGALARTAAFNQRYYEDDPELMVRLRPGRRDDYRGIRDDLAGQVTINSAGFRGDEHEPMDPDALRVLVLGDSVSFGFGVDDTEAWPALLPDLLRRDGGPLRVQVRNLAVPGYSTFQGRILFERHALGGDFAAQVVVFAFGFNDGYLRAADDRSSRDALRAARSSWLARARAALAARSHFCAWLWRPPTPSPTAVRVPPEQLTAHLDAVAAAATERGIELLLVDACLPNSYPRSAFAAAAAAHGVAALAFREAFVAHQGLPPEGVWPGAGILRIVARTHGVAIPPAPDGGEPLRLVWLDDAAQRPRHRSIPLRDQGDGSWSAQVEVQAGSRPEFGVLVPGFAAQAGEMRGPGALLNGAHLQQPPPATETLVLAAPNLCPWPDLVLLPDPIHASPAGCQLMAAAVAAEIRAGKAWRSAPRR